MYIFVNIILMALVSSLFLYNFVKIGVNGSPSHNRTYTWGKIGFSLVLDALLFLWLWSQVSLLFGLFLVFVAFVLALLICLSFA